LQASPWPVWLWDAGRLRVVWANRPAVEAFAAETLFDVLDLRFEASEPGVQELARLAAALDSETPASARLVIQAFRDGQPFQARLQPHPLPDGRAGVIIAARGSDAADQREALRIAALDALPMPVAVVNGAGDIVDANRDAMALLARDGGAVVGEPLAKLLGEAPGVARLVEDVSRSGIANRVVEAATRFGPRTLRLIARRLDADAEAIVVTIDDITERRALERELDRAHSGEPPAAVVTAARPAARPLARDEEEAFNRLGEAVRAAAPPVAEAAPPSQEIGAPGAAPEQAAASPALAEDAAAEVPAALIRPEAALRAPEAADQGEPPRRKPEGKPAGVHVPEIIKRSLDLSPIATVLFQDRTLLYANKAAVKLFGIEDVRDLPESARLVERLSEASPGEPVSLDGEDGAFEVTVRLTSFPFTTGPATKAELVPLRGEDAEEAARPLHAPRTQPLKPAVAAAPENEATPVPAVPAAPPAAATAERQRDLAGPSADELISILDTATDGIATLDDAGNILSLSAGAEAIFGLRQAEVLGQPIAALIQGDGARLVRDYLAALGESGIAAVFNDGLEVQARNTQGGSIPIFLTIGAVGSDRQGRKGTPGRAAYCAVFRDITQWKQTEAELRAAKEEAERASAQKSDFLAKISHELRTPLNAILGFSEVMRTERFGEIANQKYLGYANDIHTSGEHLLSLINDLLDLSKIETGKLELNFTAVNLSELTDHCMRLFEEDARARRIVVRKNFPPNLPSVVADLRSMKQVLLNLVSNAIKFTPPGGQVILSGQLNGNGEFVLKVKDTGIGMAEEELAVAMQPFGRIHAEERPDIPGTGLGLPLTKALAEANRARFVLTSNRGKGTLAEVTFPVNRVLGG
jgi:PAS domain S-box-containing protein